MFAPIPTLDHVVVNVRDRMDEAVEAYRGLGFTMTPRGYHTLGSMNHLAMFGTDYLELIAADPKAAVPRADVMQFPCGLNGLVFGSEDSAATYAACAAAGVKVQKPVAFSRPVALPGGARDARFATVHLNPGTIPAGRVYFCQHFTRDLVWRDEWRHHANGVIGIAAVVMVADDVDTPAAVFARMFGRDAMVAITGGQRLAVGLTNVEIISPGECAARYGEAAPDAEGRAQYMAGLVLRSRSMARIIPARAAMGAVLDLRVG